MAKGNPPSNRWIISRPSDSDLAGCPRLLYEVLSYNMTEGTITVRGRFGHTWDMEIAYAKKHYQPAPEDDLEIEARKQTQRWEGRGVQYT
jgi:hypothetical protein